MKLLSEKCAMDKLSELKTAFANEIRERYEHRAKSCVTCDTPGACCLDQHFVNVHITRLEARVIERTLRKLSEKKQLEVYQRIGNTIEKYGLADDGDSFEKTFACPLFEKGVGCLVHAEGKPLPCIHHACYENADDLPPDGLLAVQEVQVDQLNKRTYGMANVWLPLPVALSKNDRVNLPGASKFSTGDCCGNK